MREDSRRSAFEMGELRPRDQADCGTDASDAARS